MTAAPELSRIAELLPAPGEWTEADYFPLSDRGRLIELSNGNLEVLVLPTDFHQLILLRLSLALHMFVASEKLGQVRFAPLPTRLWPGKIREPDLMFMSSAHVSRIGNYWGVPDLAVEILSEGHEQRDRDVKRVEYAQAGIAEYWIVDPVARTVEILQLEAGSEAYALWAQFKVAQTLSSPMFPGFSVALAELFAAA